MCTYKKTPSNPFGIRTSEIIGLKVLQNEHFRKNPRGWDLWRPFTGSVRIAPARTIPEGR